MSDLAFNCPHCQQSLEAPEDMLGESIECPSCGGTIQIPAPDSESPHTQGSRKKAAAVTRGMSHGRSRVFISYRREGGADLARLIREALIKRHHRVFMDVENLRSGPFNTALLDEIASSTDVVAVLTPGSLERCNQPGDWLRLEIAHAIKCDKNVVPVMAREGERVFRWPRDPLPDDMAALRDYNGLSSSHEYFEASMDRLSGLLVRGALRWGMRCGLAVTVLFVALGAVGIGMFISARSRPDRKHDGMGATTADSGAAPLTEPALRESPQAIGVSPPNEIPSGPGTATRQMAPDEVSPELSQATNTDVNHALAAPAAPPVNRAAPLPMSGAQRRSPADVARAVDLITDPDVRDLVFALVSREAETRHDAAIALGKLGVAATPSVPYLVGALQDKASGGRIGPWGVAREAARALGEIGAPAKDAIPALQIFVQPLAVNDNTGSSALRVTAQDAIARIETRVDGQPDARTNPTLDIATPASMVGPELRAPADVARAIASIADPEVRDLVFALVSREAETRRDAAVALGDLRAVAVPAIPYLIEALDDRVLGGGFDGYAVATEAARALGEIGPPARDAIPALQDLIQTFSKHSHSAAITVCVVAQEAIDRIVKNELRESGVTS